MGLKKGITNNKNGRPKGVQNKLSQEMKEIIKDVLQYEFDNISETMQKLDPEKRLDIVIKLLPYVMPKLQSSDIKLEVEQERITGINYIIPIENNN